MKDPEHLLFLDFDGVLNSAEHFRRIGISPAQLNEQMNKIEDKDSQEAFNIMLRCFDMRAIERLNKILNAVPNLYIILSTHWGVNHSLERLIKVLRFLGVQRSIVGKTRRKLSMHERSSEIALTLTTWHNPVESFVILEDAWPMHDLEQYTVRTDARHGLLDEHIPRALEILSKKTNFFLDAERERADTQNKVDGLIARIAKRQEEKK